MCQSFPLHEEARNKREKHINLFSFQNQNHVYLQKLISYTNMQY